MDHSVQDCIGNVAVAYDLIPFGYEQLRGDQGRPATVTVFNDLQKDHSAAIVQRLYAEVVEDDQVCLLDRSRLP